MLFLAGVGPAGGARRKGLKAVKKTYKPKYSSDGKTAELPYGGGIKVNVIRVGERRFLQSPAGDANFGMLPQHVVDETNKKLAALGEDFRLKHLPIRIEVGFHMINRKGKGVGMGASHPPKDRHDYAREEANLKHSDSSIQKTIQYRNAFDAVTDIITGPDTLIYQGNRKIFIVRERLNAHNLPDNRYTVIALEEDESGDFYTMITTYFEKNRTGLGDRNHVSNKREYGQTIYDK